MKTACNLSLIFECSFTELLQQYSGAMQKASDVESEYNNHFKYLQSPQMKLKRQELKQQEEELRELEQTLGMCFYHCRLVFLMHSMLVMQYCILKY